VNRIRKRIPTVKRRSQYEFMADGVWLIAYG
jgi:hypothetical protein